MTRAILIVPLAILLALEVYHCSRRKGWEFALLFFAAALLFGVIRGNVVGLIQYAHGQGQPYHFSRPALRIGFTTVVEPFGWAFALYGSWFLAEGILKKVKAWQGELLPVAFVATLLMGGFSWSVEAAATPMGWWHWMIGDIEDLFFYAVPVVGIMDWASVAMDFLLPFLLFQVGMVRASRWRFALPMIFVVHMLTHLFFLPVGPFGYTFEVYHYMAVLALGSAALFVGRQLRPAGVRTQLWGRDASAVDALPFISVGGMLAIVIYATAGVSGDQTLLFSVLPLAAALLLAAPRVPQAAVAALLAAGVFVDLRVAPALLVAISPLVYGLVTAEPRSRSRTAIATLLVVLSFGAYFPWAYWRHERTETLRDFLAREPEAAVDVEPGRLQQRLELYDLICKFAGGDYALRLVFDAAWQERNREALEYAVEEFATFGYEKVSAEQLLNADSRGAMRDILRQARAQRD